MGQHELLVHAVAALDGAGVAYMLSGSLASSVQGRPRSTHDIDLVVDLRRGAVQDLLAAFPGDRYYASEQSAHDAIERGSMFNVLDSREGDKIDFWILTNEAFDRSRFSRRARIDVFGTRIWVSSPEDTILMKLRWGMQGGGDRQEEDAAGVYDVMGEFLDVRYLEQWADRLGVRPALDRIRSRA